MTKRRAHTLTMVNPLNRKSHPRKQPESFMRHVDKTGPSGCWLWTAARTKAGYGWVNYKGTPSLAHRVALLVHGVDVPADAFVCHHCDTPACVNPAHLYIGDHASNMADMVRRKRAQMGDRHIFRRQPDRCASGDAKPKTTKIPDAEITVIRASEETNEVLGSRYGVLPDHIRKIRKGDRRVPKSTSPPAVLVP